jgi:hypothetical protein
LQRSLRAAKVTVTVNGGARDGAAESFDFFILLYISRFWKIGTYLAAELFFFFFFFFGV